MSWDVMIFKFDGPPPRDLNDLRDPMPLGAAADVRTSISCALPKVDWSDPSWGILDDDQLSIEFNMGHEDPIEAIMLHVRGRGNAVAVISALARTNGWVLLDCSTGEYMDNENPSDEGWRGFQAYRDQIMGLGSRPKKDTE